MINDWERIQKQLADFTDNSVVRLTRQIARDADVGRKLAAELAQPLSQAIQELELFVVPADVIRQFDPLSSVVADMNKQLTEQMSGINALAEQMRAHTDLFENLRRQYDWVDWV
jgi:hypothetical protein